MAVRSCPVCKSEVHTKKDYPGKPCRPCTNRIKANGRIRKEPFSTRWFTRCKHNATVRGHEFSVSKEDILALWEKQGRKCALSGLDIRWAKVGRVHTISLDRIDNAKGYTLDNIQLLHKDINMMKHAFLQVYFVNLCRMIAKYAICG